MNQYQRAKLNKILIIVAIALGVIAIAATSFYIVLRNKRNKEKVNYEDTIIGKNYYIDIVIDMDTKKVKRDDRETTLQDEFGIDPSKAEIMFYSPNDVKTYFENSTVEVEMENKKIHLKNPYQTKTLIVEADEIEDDFDAQEQITIQDGLYILKYDTQKRTKAAYQYLQGKKGIKKIELDEVSIVNTINDESQTVYGEHKNENNEINDLGASAMGLDKYKNLIKENGNPSQVVVATIGYGAAIQNTYLKDRINEDYYNFISGPENTKDVHETIAQGSRMLEVIKESTTDNVKIMPLVVINDEYYTTTSSILQAIKYATEKSDVICYEFVHKHNYMVNLCLKNTFSKNIPVCCITKNGEENESIYPAEDSTTIAVSSVDKDLKTTSYSGKGAFIDFVASSTDVKEIFNSSSTVSRWSGAGYSNAHIVGAIALIKTYNKNYTILEVYNTIRNFCKDLGEQGRDNIYGYGFPNFSEIKMSDIDKQDPQITEANVDNEKWEKQKSFKLKANDNIRIYGWNITKSDKVPSDWKKTETITNNIDVTEELKENGKYYIWVTDSAGRVSYLDKEITKIDNSGPKITSSVDESKIDTEKFVTIKVTATDDESGLHENAYSWDKQNWAKDNNNLKVTKNGTYTVYVRDALENISEKKITINSFPKEGKAEIDTGLVIKEIKVSSKWEGDKNKEVTITLNNNLNIQRWQITETDFPPRDFINTQNETNTLNNNTIQQNVVSNNTIANNTITNNYFTPSQGYSNMTITVELNANQKYFMWVKDAQGNVISQGFTIKKAD